ncbi:DUF975 family protein [Listeria fleischmannii]|uniref:DUF975 family protein n=1 Tax=Listeria fleischmannii TaxID=1069827 RepID=A0A841YDQ3_9LIST|nr:DUF975 family protein [Listeria fleischmannii]MBC1398396.1 DUF975 family protein [Listeria fleischmannii]
MLTNAEIRRTAKSTLQGHWGISIGVYLLSMIISSAVSSLLGWIPVIGWIIGMLITGPISIGVVWFFLAISRKDEPDVSYMFSAFKDFGRTFLAFLLVTLFTFLWSLLFIVPGIIKGYSYSQTFFILRDNPNISALDAITESRHMMNGYKGKLFGLSLTLLLWYLIPIAILIASAVIFSIGVLTGDYNYMNGNGSVVNALGFGISMGAIVLFFLGMLVMVAISIYLFPYMTTSFAVFHDELFGDTTTFEEEVFTETDYTTNDFDAPSHPDEFGPDKLEEEKPNDPR